MLALVAVDGVTLTVEDVDILDGAPVIDIKPYVSAMWPDTKKAIYRMAVEAIRRGFERTLDSMEQNHLEKWAALVQKITASPKA